MSAPITVKGVILPQGSKDLGKYIGGREQISQDGMFQTLLPHTDFVKIDFICMGYL